MLKRCLSLLLLGAMLLSLVPGLSLDAQAATYTTADWNALIKNWKRDLCGDDSVNWDDSVIQAIVGAKSSTTGLSTSGISYKAGVAWQDLEKNRSNSKRIFGSVNMTTQTTSNDLRLQFVDLYSMARAYGTKGSSYTYKDSNGNVVTQELYKNQEFRDAIFFGLKKGLNFYNQTYFNAQRDSANRGDIYNWWDWAYGAPLEILRTLLIMYPYANSNETSIAKSYTDDCLFFINKCRPNNDGKMDTTTLGYRRSRLNICAMIATLTKNTTLMEETRTNLAYYLEPHYDTVEGVKEDGSYICHLYWPLEGTYGRDVLVNRIMYTYSAMAGTAFALSGAEVMVDWMMDTFKPTMHGNMMMAPFNGRYPQMGASYARDVYAGALMLVGAFDAASDLKLKQFIRSALIQDTEKETQSAYSYYAKALADVNLAQTMKDILVDQTIPLDEEIYGAVRFRSDRAVQHHEDYTVSLAMSSSRIAIPESINGCNRYGWFGGDGALYVYNDDTTYKSDQFGELYQRYANLYRVPGTTEEDSTVRQPWNNRKAYLPGTTYNYSTSTKKETWTVDKNKDGVDAATFVGGVEMAGTYVTAAMDFEAYSWSSAESKAEVTWINNSSQPDEDVLLGKKKQVVTSDLTAKKSYFMFDDEIVCVGTDIDFTTRTSTVNTYVDNRALFKNTTANGVTTYGTEDIMVDGVLLEETTKFSQPKSYTDPQWVHLDSFGGYYFPKGGEVYVNKTFRQASNDGDDTNDDWNLYNLRAAVKDGAYSFFELWLSHGSKPKDGQYSYVMLPEKSAEETKAYTQSPDVEIVKATTSLHVVKEKNLGITAMVFWKAGTYGDITVDKPMIVMVQEKDGKYILCASDPTQKLTTGTITINRALKTTRADSKITLSGTSKITLKINFSGSNGRTFDAEFVPQTFDQLMFDFNNKTAGKYKSMVYGYKNYSDASLWATAHMDESLTISNGFMGVPLTTQSGMNTTYIQPSNSTTNFAWSADTAKANFLSFDPGKAEIFQIRFKLTDAKKDGNYAPGFYLFYLADGAKYWSNNTNNPDYETIKLNIDEACLDGGSLEGQYVTLTMNLSSKKISTFDKIKGVCFNFGYLRGGKATIDYIYIGPKTESLLFDFSNDGTNDRFQEGAYGGHDYDRQDEPAWATACTDQAGKLFSVNNAEGTLSLYTSCNYYGTLGSGEHYGAYLGTSSVSGTYAWEANTVRHPLSYDLANAEILAVRFKTDNLVAQSGKTPSLELVSTIENNHITTRTTTGSVSFTIKDGEYQTVYLPLSAEYRSMDYLKSLDLRFTYTKAPQEGSYGKITVDYIYMGPESGLPEPRYTVTFQDENGALLQEQTVPKGEAAVYTGTTPVKAYDGENHYVFAGWDQDLTGITQNLTVKPTFTATAHSYAYTKIDEVQHKADCSCGYSKTEAHSFTDGICPCGVEDIKEPIQDSSLKINHTLNLASDISVNFAVSKSLLTGFDMDTVYMLTEMDTYEGNTKTGTTTVKLLPVEQGNYYYFTLTGLTAVQMNDRLSSVLYGTKDGQPYYSEADSYSIGDYAYSQLNKSNSTDRLKALCADLLRYGASAQTYKAYRTDALVDAAMTDTHKTYLSDLNAATFGNTDVILNDLSNPAITWVGKALNLESKVTLKFVFSTAGYSGDLSDLSLRVTYTNIEGETVTTTVEEVESYSPAQQRYAFSFDGLLAAELRSVVSVQVYVGDVPVSCTLQYSADTYGNNKTGTLGALCKALVAYSDSAKIYFTN